MEAFGKLTFNGGGEYEARQDNLRLYKHIGHFAVYDHIFLYTEENTGIYIWAQIPPDNPNFTNLEPHLIDNSCELHINIQEPAQSDIDAFERHATSDIDEIPKDWL